MVLQALCRQYRLDMADDDDQLDEAIRVATAGEKEFARGLSLPSKKLEARIAELEKAHKEAELLWWDEKGELEDRIAELEKAFRPISFEDQQDE